MNAWLALSPGVRIALVALDGLLLGVLVNWAAAALTLERRRYSPWIWKQPRDVRPTLVDRLPIFGWMRLRRFAETLGPGFWIRPLVVEIGCGAAAAALYWWEALQGGLLITLLVPRQLADPVIAVPLHLAFTAHLVLGAFMLAASLIDADEMYIPDAVTVPGTLVGLTLATLGSPNLLESPLLPGEVVHVLGQTGILYVYSTYPSQTVGAPLQNFPNFASLAIVVGCYWLWCGGLLNRVWRPSREYRRALQLFLHRLVRDTATKWIVLLASVGTALIVLVWLYDDFRWIALGTSLIGLAVGGGVVWWIRLIASRALGQEAMGFGDVTLMAMIGTLVGWQAALLIFFAAPAAAVVLGVVQWLVTRSNVLPYGPFLCLSTAAIVVGWATVWDWAGERFAIPWLIPGVVAVGLVLLGLILFLLRLVRGRP